MKRLILRFLLFIITLSIFKASDIAAKIAQILTTAPPGEYLSEAEMHNSHWHAIEKHADWRKYLK